MNAAFRPIGGLVIALAALTQYTSAQTPAITARTIEDRDHVTVMELAGAYDRQPDATRAQEIAIRQAIARELLRQHADDYDFIVSFAGFPFDLGGDAESRVGGRYYEIKNDVQGIGLAEFDRSAEWGSNGRLQGYIDMGALASLVTDPTDPLFERTLGILAHEVAHRWGAHLRFQNADGSPNASLLGLDAAHWSFFVQSHNSVLYGNDWRDNGDGTFTSVGRSRSFYSPLDLYAMGMLDPGQVPPFFVIEGAAGDPARLPELGVTVSGTSRPVSIDDVIAVEGPRVPGAASAPKQFKIAFVYLVRPGENADGAELRAINNVREAFATRMLILTGGKAVVEIFPDVPTSPIGDPATVLPPSSGPRTAAIDLAQGIAWLLSRQAATGGFADSPSTSVRDTAAVIDLLAGHPAAFTHRQSALAWLSTLTAASNVDTVARRMAAIAPQYSAADSAYLLGAQHPQGGWGLRVGDEADPFDTALVLSPLQIANPAAAIGRLVAAQLPDGSWPMHPGGSGSILATAAVLRLSGRFSSAPLADALTRASAWLETRQNNDGGFGESGSTVFETALAILHAASVSSTRIDVRWAVEFLRRGQLADGSWNESVYETALAIRALQIGDLPNVALVASSLAFSPADPVEGEVASLSALLANTGSTELTNVSVRFYDGHPESGGLPIGEDVVIASLPAQARVPVNTAWNTTDRAGVHQVVVAADPGGALEEANEADNVLSGSLQVRPPPEEADLVIAAADLAWTPDQLLAVPQAQTFRARISNVGRTAVPLVRVTLFAGDPAAGGMPIAETDAAVPARGASEVVFQFVIESSGERSYFVVVDSANDIAEADEANNTASRLLPVRSAFDLFVDEGSITFSQNPAALGQDLTIDARIGNSGTADVFGARVRIFIDDPTGAIDVATLTLDLPAGQIRPVSATWRTSRALTGVPVIVHVDPMNAFAEVSETNNQSSAALSVQSSTDANLQVSHATLQITTPVLQGGTATISIPVHNTGFADAADVGVAFYNGAPGSGGAQIGATQTIPILAAGAQATASVVWDSITAFGDKLIYVVVDPAGAVVEFDEQDNTAFITVDVLSLPDLAVSPAAISFNPPFPRQDEPVVLSALISNTGEQAALNAVVGFFSGDPGAGGVQIGGDQVISVPPAGRTAAQMPFTLTTNPGVTAIFVQVDPSNAVVELNETNNTASRSLGVQNGSVYFSNLYFSPNGDEVQDRTEFFYRLESEATAIRAIGRDGDAVREFMLDPPAASGAVEWDGRDGLGRIAPDGDYRFAVLGPDGGELASATVVLDNNNLPVGDALGTEYLLQNNLTCQAGTPTSVGWDAPGHHHKPALVASDFRSNGWLADDSGLLTWVPTQLQCAALTSTGGNYYHRCGDYRYLTSPEVGVYVTSADGRTRNRITPSSWTQRTAGGPTTYTATSLGGTQIIGAVPSPDGRKVVVGLRKYRYYPVACGNCGGLPIYHFEWTTQIQLWALNTDGSGLADLGTVEADDRFGVRTQTMPDVAWSPDGGFVAVWNYHFAGNGYEYFIDVARTDGSARTRVASVPVGWFIGNRDITWTSDASRLVYLTGNHSSGERAWYVVTPDGQSRTELDLPEGVSPTNGMWLGSDRFANLIWENDAQHLHLFSLSGEAPRRLSSNVENVGAAAVAPDGKSIAYTDRARSDWPNPPPRRISTGIWRVDAGGAIERLHAASPENLGVESLAWTRDSRRIAFIESVITDYRTCDDSDGGLQFCGDAFFAIGAIDVADRSVRIVETTRDVEWSSRYDIAGFFPDGNSFLLFEEGVRLVALGIDDGRRHTLFEDPYWSNFSASFTPSGKYLLFESGRESSQPGMPCYTNGTPDTWLLGSLLNLTTDFTFRREQSHLVIHGTAVDRNFASYTLEAASTDAPGQWSAIDAPSDTPVINNVLALWIPPSDGTFIVRLTATDLAGNRSTTRKRVTWGLVPAITNVQVTPRVFSPNGDGSHDATTVGYVVLGPVNLTFTVHDAQNAVVRTIEQSHEVIGPASLVWDGRTEDGQIVSAGVYRIHVLQYDFFVTVDTTPPDVRLTLGSGFRVVEEKRACVQTPGGLECTIFDGPLVDTPTYALAGRVYDASLKTWVLEVGTGSNPSEWIVVTQGSDLLVARDRLNQPAVPIADTIIRALPDAGDVVGKRYRLTATDQAGNLTRVVGQFAPEEIILYAWDGVPVPTTRDLEQVRGPHLLSVLQTVRAPLAHLTLQYRQAGSEVWVNGAAMALPAARVAFPWDNSTLAGGRTYEVRLAGADASGATHLSNVVKIHSDLFELTDVESNGFTRSTRTHGVASLREPLTDIRLVMDTAGDPDIGLTAANFSDPVTFSIAVAPDPSNESCLGRPVNVRFKGIGQSGRIYYSNTRTVTRFGVPDSSCSSLGRGALLELTATRVSATHCGAPNPERVLIRLTGHGIEPGTQRLLMQDAPNTLFRELEGIALPFALDLDTSQRAAGIYHLQATARATEEAGGALVTATAVFVVDRTPPTAQITFPADNTSLCPVRTGGQSLIAIEGVADDANFDRYVIEYSRGDGPELWVPLFPAAGSQAELEASRVPKRGVLANIDAGALGGGFYRLRLQVFDKGGNVQCHTVAFTVLGGVGMTDVQGDLRLISPNGDGNRDSLAIGFALDAPALVDAHVFAVENGVRAALPTRTLLSGAQHLAGSNNIVWDGQADLGGAVPDGRYHVVLTARDACGNPITAFTEVDVDSTAPEAVISSPAAGEMSRVVIEVRGTVSDAHFTGYRLEVGAGDVPSEWTVLRDGGAPVRDALLGTWNTRAAPGPYTLRLIAFDAAGNSREVLLAVSVPQTDPLITSVTVAPLVFSPNGDGTLDTASVEFVASALAQVVVEAVSGETVLGTLLSQPDTAAGTHTLVWDGRLGTGETAADGEYVLRLTATGVADPGRVQTESVPVVVDTTAPALAVASPSAGAHVRGDVQITGSVVDRNIDAYSVSYGTAAAGPGVVLEEGRQSRTDYTFGALRDLADGAYLVRITASDLAGNTLSLDRTFTRDNESPTVALLTPEAGTLAGGPAPVLQITGSVTEPNLQQWTLRVGRGLEPSAWTSLVAEAAPPAGDQLGSWDTTGLEDGAYTLSLQATDRAAATTEARVHVIVDHTPPVAVVRQPSAGSRIGSTFAVRGDATDANFASATLEISDGPAETAARFVTLAMLQTAVSDGVLFTLGILPEDGIYTLRLTVQDLLGQRTETLRTIIIDTEPLPAPLNLVARVENRSAALLSWSAVAADDVAGYHVYRNGLKLTSQPVADATYLDQTPGQGIHLYTVTVVDAGGLESERSNEASVKIDIVAPAAHIQSPSNGSSVGALGDVVDVLGTAASADDFREYRVLVGAGPTPAAFTLIRRSPAPVSGALLAEWDTTALAPGTLMTLRLEAEDLSGNTASDQVTVTIDNSVAPAAPVILSAAQTGTGITVTWQAPADGDLAGYLVYNNDLLANARRVVTGSLTPYIVQGTSYVDEGLVDGVYEYYVVAIDKAGNTSAPSNTLQAVLDARAPTFTIIRPLGGPRVDMPVELEATSPDTDLASVQFQIKTFTTTVWSNLGARVTAPPYVTTWDPRGFSRLSYLFRAVGTDIHGNTDTNPPTIVITHADVTKPEPPTNVTARVNEGTVTVSWTRSVSSDVSRYNVYRLVGNAEQFVGSPGALTTFNRVNVADGQYSYVVRAIDTSSNQSDRSNTADVRVSTPALTAPATCVAAPSIDIHGSGVPAGATVTLFLGAAPVATATSSTDGVFVFEDVALAGGGNTFTAQATDASGNLSKRSPPLVVTFSALPGDATEIQAQVLGHNLARVSGVTVTSSSALPGGPAANAIDGDPWTSWYTASGDAANLGTSPFLQLTLPADATVTRIRMLGNREIEAGHDFLAGRFELFDAAGAVVFDSGNLTLSNPARDIVIDVPGAAGVRGARFTPTADEGSSPGLAELEVIGTYVDVSIAGRAFDVALTWTAAPAAAAYVITRGGVNLGPPTESVGGTASASTSWGGNVAANVLDGNPSTSWGPTYWIDPAAWWQIDFPAPVAFRGIRVDWHPSFRVAEFSIQHWDGSAWVSVATVRENTLSQNVVALENAVVTSRVRLQIVAPQSTPFFVSEIDVLVGGPTAGTSLTDLRVPPGVHLYAVTPINACLVEGAPAQVQVSIGDIDAPQPPSGLAATVAGHDVSLQWVASLDADVAGYHVYRQQEINGGWTRVTPTPRPGTEYVDDALANGDYRYRVTAIDDSGNESGPSNEVDAIVAVAGPAPPGALTAVVTVRDVALEWPASADPVDGYHVYRSANAGDWTRLTGAPIAQTTYEDPFLPDGTYRYRVAALDGFGTEGPFSGEAEAIVAAAPEAPALAVMALPTGGVLDLSWTPAAFGTPPIGFRLSRSATAGGPYEPIHTGLLTSTEYRDDGVTNGVTYYYVVRAIGELNSESAPSNEAAGTPADTLSETPILFYPTDAAHPKTVVSGLTSIRGRAEPGATVDVVRAGISLGSVVALANVSAVDLPLQFAAEDPPAVTAAAGLLARFVSHSANPSPILAVTNVLTRQTRDYAATAGGALPAISGDGLLASYTSDSDGHKLHLLDLASGTITRTITLPHAPLEQALDRNGRRSALVLDNPSTSRDQIWIADLITGEVTQLTSETARMSSPVWSPDGVRIAYARAGRTLVLAELECDDDTGELVCEPDLDDTVEIDHDFTGDLRFSFDGARLSFSSGDSAVVYDVLTGDDINLPENEELDDIAEETRAPALSPDGASVAYLLDDGSGSYDLWTERLDGQEPMRLQQDVSEDLTPFWIADGSIALIGIDRLVHVRPPGHFQVDGILLDRGLNLISAIGVDTAGNHSQPADPITVTWSTAGLGDLAIAGQDFSAYPLFPSPGQQVRLAATVQNVGSLSASGVTVAFFEIDQDGSEMPVGAIQNVGSIAPGGRATAEVGWVASTAGAHRFVARADVLGAIAEVSEANNSASREVMVGSDPVPSVRLLADRASYAPDGTVRLTAAASNPSAPAGFTIEIAIEDALGNPVAPLLRQTISAFPYGTREFAAAWPAAGALAGAYQARATFTRGDGLTTSATIPFTIEAVESVTVNVSTDRAGYLAGELVQITGMVRNTSPNVNVTDISASIDVRAADGVVVLHTEAPVGMLMIDAQAQIRAAVAAAVPGAYAVEFRVRQGDRALGVATRSFTVTGVARLAGTLELSPPRVALGEPAAATVNVTNTGTLGLDGVTLRLRLIDPATQVTVSTFERNVALAIGESVPWTLTIPTAGLSPKAYTAILDAQSDAAGATGILTTASVLVADLVAPTVQVLSPVAELYTRDDVAFTARALDNASAVVRVEFRVDEGPWQQMAPADLASGSYIHRYGAAPATEGAHVLSIRASDAAGNGEFTASDDANPVLVPFTIDVTAPVIVVTGVENGTTYHDAVTPVIMASDAALVSTTVTLDGAPFTSGTVIAADGAHTLTVDAIDRAGNVASIAVQFTLEINRPPLAESRSVLTTEDTAVDVALGASDPDGDALTYVVTAAGHGTLQGTPPALVYVPNADFHGLDQFTFTVSDGAFTSAPATVSITVTAVNDPPIARVGAAQDVDERTTVTLDGAASSDVDEDALTYRWTQTSGTTAVLDLSTPSRPTFTAPEVPPAGDTLTFQLVVSDGPADSAPAEVHIRVRHVNRPPSATGQTVTANEDEPLGITLVAADPDGDALTFELTAAANGTVTGTAPSVTYTPAQDFNGTDGFTFTVRDPEGLSASATVSITVAPVNDRPVALVGANQNVLEGDAVTLDGSASSDPEGDALSYRWTQIDGVPVVLDVNDAARPTFTAPEVAAAGDSLTFELIVNDGQADSAPARVVVSVGNVNRPPTIDGMTVSTAEDVTVVVTVAASDGDGDALTFEVSTPPAHGSVAGSGPEFTYTPAADFSGADAFDVTVRDSGGLSAVATIALTVTPVNDRPIARPGADQTVNEGVPVTLDGSASSDADGDPLTWLWAQVSGPAVELAGVDTAQVSFVAPEAPRGGITLTFRLIVADGAMESEPALVNVIVKNINHAPVAEAGPDQRVGSGAPVTLDGSRSYDPDADPITYRWTQVDGPLVELASADNALATFITPIVGAATTLTFELEVSDAQAIATDRVTVQVDPVNRPPTANAGPDQSVQEGARVDLDGSGSSDPDGDQLTYRWMQVAGTPVPLSDGAAAQPSFTAPRVGPTGETLSFELVVNDGILDSAAGRVDIHVRAAAAPPVCSLALASPAVLWPPNHKLMLVRITGLGVEHDEPNNGDRGDGNDRNRRRRGGDDDDQDGDDHGGHEGQACVSLRITKVTQDEPVNGTGDGDTGPDAVIDGGKVFLRAERAAGGNGRVYRIWFEATDQDGRPCTGSVTVQVPHDANRPAIDDAQHYDSTVELKKKGKN